MSKILLTLTTTLFLLVALAATTTGVGNSSVPVSTLPRPSANPDTPLDHDYGPQLDALYDYLLTQVGDFHNADPDDCYARSEDWGIYHECHPIAHGAMVTGATTSETMGPMAVMGLLYDDLRADDQLEVGTIDYIRRYMMPHDGVASPELPDNEHTGPYQPCLLHWLVDVDGGTTMSDTGTIIGPNIAYLPYEYHKGEDPIDDNPDRESYIGPNNYKYASAPDADQWLAAGLLMADQFEGQQTHQDLALCLVNSLQDGLTVDRDFRQGIIEDFERGWPGEWKQEAFSDTVLISQTLSPGMDDTDHLLQLTYHVPWHSYGSISRPFLSDWSEFEGVEYDGVRLWFHGEGQGDLIRVQVTDEALDAINAYEQEYFEYLIADTISGWRSIEIPFANFTERTDWPPDYADTGNGELDLEAIRGFGLEPLKATFYENFEHPPYEGWWKYAEQGGVLHYETMPLGANGTAHALKVIYDIATGYVGAGASPADDWSNFDTLSFWIQGTNSGNNIRIELVEQEEERWMHIIKDTFIGWQEFTIPLEQSEAGFIRRFWQPDGVVENYILDWDRIREVVFSPIPGWFADDFEDEDAGDWWIYEGGGGSISHQVVDEGANGTEHALKVNYYVPSGGWAGTGKTVNRDWNNFGGVELWMLGSGGTVTLRLKDDDEECYDYVATIPTSWTKLSIPIDDFIYQDLEGCEQNGNQKLDKDLIRAFVVQPPSPSSGTLYLDEITVIGSNLGQGEFGLDEVRLEGPGARPGEGVALIDEIMLMGGPAREVYTNVMKFSLQWNQDGPIDWEGPLYSAYQDPAPYYLAGEPEIASDIVTFLAAAQGAYDAQDGVEDNNLGPFMPIFIQDPQYSKDRVTGWTFDGRAADPYTFWGQFQYRTFAHLAKYYYWSHDPEAKAILDNYYNWLKEPEHWQVDQSGSVMLPTTFITDTETVSDVAYRPGDHALAAQALIYLAAESEEAMYREDAEALLDTLAMHQDALGAFPNNDEDLRFGFEQAEVGIAFGLYHILLEQLAPNLQIYLPLIGNDIAP